MSSAWEEVYYLIVSIHERRPLNTNVWRLTGQGVRRFEWIPLEIMDEAVLRNDSGA
jgi:hypothetical protein